MYELKNNWKGILFTSKFVGTGPSSYKKRIYRTAVSQRLRNTGLWGYDPGLPNISSDKQGQFTYKISIKTVAENSE
jgi:hypothetical protein